MMFSARKPANFKGDHRLYSPFRSPDWRWVSACDAVQQNRRTARWEDPEFKNAIEFRRELERAASPIGEVTPRALQNHWSAHFVAHQLFTAGGVQRDELEARLLCETPYHVSVRMSISIAIIHAYTSMYFDVRDVHGLTDWLLCEVIGIGQWATQPPTEAQVWKYMALTGGPLILDLIV